MYRTHLSDEVDCMNYFFPTDIYESTLLLTLSVNYLLCCCIWKEMLIFFQYNQPTQITKIPFGLHQCATQTGSLLMENRIWL